MVDMENPIEGTLADSIAMLEQILEVMPQDAEALKALYSAFCQGGRRTQAFDYLNQLVDVAEGGGDSGVLEFISAELPSFEAEYPLEVAAQFARLRMHDLSVKLASGGPATTRSEQPQKAESDFAEELALAWRLYEEKQLSQEEYSSVLHDLTEISERELNVPSSVLHVLSDSNFMQINRVINHMSSHSGSPCISLADFELDDRLARILPLEILSHDGVLPFAFFGNDLLVGVLNPFNSRLLEKVEKSCGHRCHSFLVEPKDYDSSLEKVRTLLDR